MGMQLKSKRALIAEYVGERDPDTVTTEEVMAATGASKTHVNDELVRLRNKRKAEDTGYSPTHARPFFGQAYQRASDRVAGMIKAGAAPESAIQQVHRETDILVCLGS